LVVRSLLGFTGFAADIMRGLDVENQKEGEEESSDRSRSWPKARSCPSKCLAPLAVNPEKKE